MLTGKQRETRMHSILFWFARRLAKLKAKQDICNDKSFWNFQLRNRNGLMFSF